MKKIFAVIMALAMALSLAVCAFAEDAVLLEGSTELEGGTYWAMDTTFDGNDNAGGDPLAWVEDWTTITKVVLKSDANFIIGYRMADGSWTQLDGKSEYTVDYTAGDIMTVNDGTTQKTGDGETGLAIPEFLIAISTGDAGTVKIEYTIYGAAAAEAAEPETTEPETTEPEAVETPAETPAETTAEAPAETETSAPSTGLALAVVPAVIAMAAAVVAKKH